MMRKRNKQIKTFQNFSKLTAGTISLGLIAYLILTAFVPNEPTAYERENGSIDLDMGMPSSGWMVTIAPIYIDDDNPGQQWVENPWVNGSGTFGEPYTISNLTIDAKGVTENCLSIRDSSAYFRIVNCTFLNPAGTNPTGIYLENVENGTLQNNTCAGLFIGMNILSAINLSIVENNCSNCGYGIVCQGINSTITGNNCTNAYLPDFFDDGRGIYIMDRNNTISWNNCSGSEVGIELTNAHNSTVYDNNFSLCTLSGGLLGFVENLTLSRNDFGATGIVWEETTLESLLSNTIEMSNIVKNKPLRVLSNQVGVSIPQDTGQVFLLNCNDSIIEGLDAPIAAYFCKNLLMQENQAIEVTSGIRVLYSKNITVVNNDYSKSIWRGLDLENTNDSIVRSNDFSSAVRSGIYLYRTFNSTLQNNNCSLSNNGISLANTENFTISDNVNEGCLSIGIDISGSQNGTLFNNTCSKSGYIGIQLWFSTKNLTIEENYCSNSIRYGMRINQAHNNTFRGNNCTGNGEEGIYINQGLNNTLEGNKLGYNAKPGLLLDQADGSRVISNWIGRNLDGVVLNSSHYANITGNTIWKNLNWSVALDKNTESSTVTGNSLVKISEGVLDLGTGNLISGNPLTSYPTVVVQTINATNILAGQSVQVTGVGSGGVNPYEYFWDWGDGSSNNNGQSVTHQYNASGSFTITLTLTDGDGDKVLDSTTVNVAPNIPMLSFSLSNQKPNKGEEITVTAAVTGGIPPFEYTWDWGDETPISIGQSATHTYDTPGNYTITLTIKDRMGITVTTKMVITVVNPSQNDISGFSISLLVILVPLASISVFLSKKTKLE